MKRCECLVYPVIMEKPRYGVIISVVIFTAAMVFLLRLFTSSLLLPRCA